MTIRAKTAGQDDLKNELVPGDQAQGPFLLDLEVIVEEADEAEEEHRAHAQPDIAVAQVSPEQRRNERRADDQDAAHGRRAFLGEMGLRPFGPDFLADLVLFQERMRAGPRRKLRNRAVMPASAVRTVM